MTMTQEWTDAISVVLPAFNEEGAIGGQVDAIRAILTQHGIRHEIIVVDDGSRDRTAEEALRTGARLLKHFENRGYGASLKTGIIAAKHEMIVITDADGTYPTEEIPSLLGEIEKADMVVGARIGSEVHIPLIRRPAKWILGLLAQRVAGRRIPDLNSGLRVFRRDCIRQYFPILSDQFSFTTTCTLALLADGYRIVYHPINYYRRVGQSKITPGHFMDFMSLVLRLAMLFQPLKVFVPMSLGCGLLGVGKVAYDIMAFHHRHQDSTWSIWYDAVISSSALLLLLVALQLLLIGMVADGVIRRIAQHSRPLAPSHALLVSEPRMGDLAPRETEALERNPAVAK